MSLYAPQAGNGKAVDATAWTNTQAALAQAMRALAGSDGVLTGLTCNGSGNIVAGIALIGGYQVSAPLTAATAITPTTDGTWDIYLQAQAITYASSGIATTGTYPASSGVEVGVLKKVVHSAGPPSGAPSVLLCTVVITSGAYVSANNAPVGRVNLPTIVQILALIAATGSNLPSVKCVAVGNISSLIGLTATIDGQSLSANDRVLLTGQTTASQNGIWQAESGAWTRPVDYPSGGTVRAGQFVLVEVGTTYGGSIWALTGTASIVVDTTATSWFVTTVVGALLAANNLSDLASAATARTNLGVGQAFTDEFNGDGTTTAFTLTKTPIGLIRPFVGTERQSSTQWTLAGTTVTFGFAPVAGTKNVVIDYMG